MMWIHKCVITKTMIRLQLVRGEYASAAHLAGIDAVHLSELLHCPLRPPCKGGGATKLLHFCNKELMWPGVGHYTRSHTKTRLLC